MGKKGIAALVIGLSLFCAAGLIGFIYLVKSAAERREAVLVTTHRDGTDEVRRWRWWLVRRGDEWKMYDNEDLAMGIRGCSLLAASTTPEMLAFEATNPGKYLAAVNALRQVE